MLSKLGRFPPINEHDPLHDPFLQDHVHAKTTIFPLPQDLLPIKGLSPKIPMALSTYGTLGSHDKQNPLNLQ